MRYFTGILVLFLVSCGPDLVELNNKAVELEANQDYVSALKIRTQILENDPDNLDAIYNRAVCYQAIGKLNLAEDDYVRILSTDSIHLESNFNLGALYQSAKKLEASTRCFSRIIGDGEAVFNIAPSPEKQAFNIYYEALYQRGNSNFMLKNWIRAKADFEICIEHNYKAEKSKELVEFCDSQNNE